MFTTIRYSRWDGSQGQEELGSQELLDALSDDLLYHGDISRALRQLMQRGFSRQSGQQMRGVQEMLRNLRERRQEMLARDNLNSLYQDIKDRLDRIVEQERETLQRRLDEHDRPQEAASEQDNQALKDMLQRMARKNLDTLDQLSENPAEAIQQLSDYEFLDPEAGREFQELLQMLRKNVLDSFFQNLTQQVSQLTPENMKQLQEMSQELNKMLRQKLQGQEHDFDGFMQRFGHMFGSNPPQSLDDLINQLQQQMSQMQSLLNSLSQQQQDDLLDMLSSQLFDQSLQDELSELAAGLDMLSPAGISGNEYRFFGDEPLNLSQAMQRIEQLHQMDKLEKQLERTRYGADLDDIDEDLLTRQLGEDAAHDLEELKRLAKMLEEAGLVERKGGELSLTGRGMRKIGQKALRDIFERMKKDAFGNHPVKNRGIGREQTDDTKRYEFGDPFFLDLKQTLMNALEHNTPGVPVRLTEGDFEVHRTERLSRTTTVLMLDLSRSMPMRGNFVAAKKVAMALNSLIRTQFPRDTLYLVGFSGYAREVADEELPKLSVGDLGRGTNIQAGLRVARRLLARHRNSQRQVILITDGEPTAYYEADGRLYIEFPPSMRVLRETLKEVRRCTKEEIVINTFMLERSAHLRAFVSELAKVNRGRVLFSSPEELGSYIMVDYMGNKARRTQRL